MPSCSSCQRSVAPEALSCASCGAAVAHDQVAGHPADHMIGETIRGVYFIQEKLGAGGMGQVYKALHLGIDAPVALKILHRALLADPTVVQRFHQEARAVARLSHPNIIRVTDAGQTEGGTFFIAMEFVAGKSLAQVLAEEFPLSEQRIVHVGAQILSALAEAHANQILHRDLKPGNVMLESRRDEPDSVKVLDFGIAKMLEPGGDGQTTLTQQGLVCGTPSYMSPEQWGNEDLDARGDLYSVGVTLYEMLTGTLPFEARTPTELVRKHLTERVPPPSTRRADRAISADLEALVLRALSANRDERPASAEQMRAALLACVLLPAPVPPAPRPLPDTTVVPQQDGPPEPEVIDTEHLATGQALPRRRWKTFAIIAATAGVAVLCATAVLILATRPPATLTIDPGFQSVAAGRGEATLTATLRRSNAPISWNLEGPGRISTAGRTATYVPPTSAGTGTIATITASAEGLTASATVTITPRSLTISPAAASVASGGGQVTFSAAVVGVDGPVRWTLNGPGRISPTDADSTDYTPPTARGSGSATVIATADDLTTSATISIIDQGLEVTPSLRQLWVGGGSAMFTATLTGSDAPISWSLSGPGHISAGRAGARYTPPTSLTGLRHTATVTAMAGTLTASATIKLTVPVLSIRAGSRVASAGGPDITLSATAPGSNAPVRWSLEGPGKLSPTTGTSVKYIPPTALFGPAAAATVTATTGMATDSAGISIVDNRVKSQPVTPPVSNGPQPHQTPNVSEAPIKEPEWGQGGYRPPP